MLTSSSPKLTSKDSSLPILRTESTTTGLSSSENMSLSSAESSPRAHKSSKKDLSLRNQKPITRSQRSAKIVANLPKTNLSKNTQLLDKYNQKNTDFKNEEFTQQACSFIAKIASGEAIPKEIQGNCSLYYILVSIAKIFMLNEYELTMLACMFDHCDWNVEGTVREDEEGFLKEFPCSLEIEITKESRRLIIYLMLLTYNLKSTLNDKSEMDLIIAYCEKICRNFSDMLRRSAKVLGAQKMNFPSIEINRKFNFLSKKDNKEPFMKIVKDYNMVVESILRLTGSHTIKPKVKAPHTSKTSHKVKAFEDSHESPVDSRESHTGESITDTDIFYADFGNTAENFRLPEVPRDFSRQGSFMECKREADIDIFHEEEGNLSKKFVGHDGALSFFQQNDQSELFNENFFDMVDLGRKPSTMSQMQEEIPLFSRLDSNFSLFGTK